MRHCLVRKPGFSLVELVIVVVIIGVVAAIAVPRISRGAKGACEASLRGSLKTLRDAIDMYTGEHDGASPAVDKKEQTLTDQLTKKTDAFGNVGTAPGVHIHGPYLRSIPPLPVGPNVGATGFVMKNDDPRKVYENKSDGGWVYNYDDGDIFANTDDLDESGVAYDTY